MSGIAIVSGLAVVSGLAIVSSLTVVSDPAIVFSPIVAFVPSVASVFVNIGSPSLVEPSSGIPNLDSIALIWFNELIRSRHAVSVAFLASIDDSLFGKSYVS